MTPAEMTREAERLVADDLYETAEALGLLLYLRPTRVDPGCWDGEVDYECGPLMVNGKCDLEMDVEARVGKRYLFRGRYYFRFYPSGRLGLDGKGES